MLGLQSLLPLNRGVRLKIYPTLNLQQGKVISSGGRGTPCAESPHDLVTRLLDDGTCRLALVDVDAAMGQGNNRELIAQLLQKCHARDRKLCIQVAGGIRSSDQAQFFIDLGVTWLVAGTILHKSPLVAEQLMARFQAHLTAAIDARGGMVHRWGWAETLNLTALELALRAKAYGFKRLIFVDIPDGPAADPDFRTAQDLEAIPTHPWLKGALVDALVFREHPHLLPFLQAACA